MRFSLRGYLTVSIVFYCTVFVPDAYAWWKVYGCTSTAGGLEQCAVEGSLYCHAKDDSSCAPSQLVQGWVIDGTEPCSSGEAFNTDTGQCEATPPECEIGSLAPECAVHCDGVCGLPGGTVGYGQGDICPTEPAQGCALDHDGDNDGIPDDTDPDVDNDGDPNETDPDDDNDGDPDNTDPDDDNDGNPDETDPGNPDNGGGGGGDYSNEGGGGLPTYCQMFPTDADCVGCPVGQHKDPISGECVADELGGDFGWDGSESSCVNAGGSWVTMGGESVCIMPNAPGTDTDDDGDPDETDPDVDNDGIPNETDDDHDNDGIPNESDPDSPIFVGGGGGDGVQQDIFGGPCDPSERDYYECLSLSGNMPDHTTLQVETVEDAFQNFYAAINNAPIVESFSNISNLITEGGSCSPFSVDLSGTIIGQQVSTTIHCELAEMIRPVIGPVMLIFWTLTAFRIFASA